MVVIRVRCRQQIQARDYVELMRGVLLSHAWYCNILKSLASGVRYKYLETLNDNSCGLVHIANTFDVIVH